MEIIKDKWAEYMAELEVKLKFHSRAEFKYLHPSFEGFMEWLRVGYLEIL